MRVVYQVFVHLPTVTHVDCRCVRLHHQYPTVLSSLIFKPFSHQVLHRSMLPILAYHSSLVSPHPPHLASNASTRATCRPLPALNPLPLQLKRRPSILHLSLPAPAASLLLRAASSFVLQFNVCSQISRLYYAIVKFYNDSQLAQLVWQVHLQLTVLKFKRQLLQ